MAASNHSAATIPQPNSAFLEVEEDLGPEYESTFDRTTDTSLNASIAFSVHDYKYENGRRYQVYREDAYNLPNDEAEQNRLDLTHHIFRLSLGGHLFKAPIGPDPKRVLDFGCGTGIWTIDFADEYPKAMVIGTDLSPIQPSWVPPNVDFYIEDVESDWEYGDEDEDGFDLVHGRGIAGGISDWDRLYHQSFTNLKPGGWLEMQEYETWIKSDDDPEYKNVPNVYKWQRLVNEASVLNGKELNFAENQKAFIEKAGFIDVKDDIYKIPIGPWPKDPRLKELGRFQLEQAVAAIEPFTLGFITKLLNWSREDCTDLTTKVITELRDPKNHLYCNFHFVYGQKPEEK